MSRHELATFQVRLTLIERLSALLFAGFHSAKNAKTGYREPRLRHRTTPKACWRLSETRLPPTHPAKI